MSIGLWYFPVEPIEDKKLIAENLLKEKIKDIFNIISEEHKRKYDMKEKWIQKSIKKPGALHKSLGIPKGEKIPTKKLNAAANKSGKLGQRARLDKTLIKINK